MTEKNNIYIDDMTENENIFNNSSNGNSWVDLVNSELAISIIDKQMSTISEDLEDTKENHLNVGEILWVKENLVKECFVIS